jgi:hypothetical protein
MENLTLGQLGALLSLKNKEVEDIKADLASAKSQLASANAWISSTEQKLLKLEGKETVVANNEPKPLRLFIKDALANSNEPLTVKEVEELVLEAGYKTKSKTFRNLVFQVLFRDNEFKRVTKPKTRPVRYTLEEYFSS